MRTFADVKRRLKEIKTFRSENFINPAWGGKRTILKVRTNSIVYLNAQGDKGYGDFPKNVKDVVVKENSVTFLDPATRKPAFTWHLQEAL